MKVAYEKWLLSFGHDVLHDHPYKESIKAAFFAGHMAAETAAAAERDELYREVRRLSEIVNKIDAALDRCADGAEEQAHIASAARAFRLKQRKRTVCAMQDLVSDIIDEGGDRRPVSDGSLLAAYRQLERSFLALRASISDDRPEDRPEGMDALLGEMDVLWWKLSDAERRSLWAEPEGHILFDRPLDLGSTPGEEK